MLQSRRGMLACADGRTQAPALSPHETDNILDVFHGLGGDLARPRGAIDENRIDVLRILPEPLQLGAYRPELFDREFRQRVLEARELRAAIFLQHVRLWLVGERRED